MKESMELIAVLPQGLEDEGAKELQELGAFSLKRQTRSVSFQADWKCFYKIHLLARLPFRFYRQIDHFSCDGPNSLYEGIQKTFDWNRWLPPSRSFRVDVTGSSYRLTHSHFSALQVKNAIVDLQRARWGHRSDINLQNPDLCIHVHLNREHAFLSLATSVRSLHRRGFRPAMGLAPLKENLAAGLLRMSNWDSSQSLVDPLCGSGTFLLEAASMAIGLAPGLNQSFIFQNWIDFEKDQWKKEQELVKSHMSYSSQDLPPIIGCEQNLEIAQQAKNNISMTCFEESVEIRTGHFKDLELPSKKGFLVCNPPYGKRISNENELENLYEELGDFCKKKASGWQLWLLNGNPRLSKFLRMKSHRRFPVSNGGIDCRWLNYLIN